MTSQQTLMWAAQGAKWTSSESDRQGHAAAVISWRHGCESVTQCYARGTGTLQAGSNGSGAKDKSRHQVLIPEDFGGGACQESAVLAESYLGLRDQSLAEPLQARPLPRESPRI